MSLLADLWAHGQSDHTGRIELPTSLDLSVYSCYYSQGCWVVLYS
jgi:hypothetical protein